MSYGLHTKNITQVTNMLQTKYNKGAKWPKVVSGVYLLWLSLLIQELLDLRPNEICIWVYGMTEILHLVISFNC